MKTLIGLKECIGKTVVDVAESDDFAMAVHFSDGTCCVFIQDSGEYGWHRYGVKCAQSEDVADYTGKLHELKMISDDEHREIVNRACEEHNRKSAEDRRREYEKLKAEFEGK